MNFESLVSHIDTVQHALQAQAAHAVNLSLTARNWLIGYYIVEFEQNGEDRAAYGEQLLKKRESRLHTKGLTERRFREFRRLYQVYPQLQSSVIQYLDSNTAIRRLATAELQNVDIRTENWQMPVSKLFNKLPYSHLKFISKIENPVKHSFYEMGSMTGRWLLKTIWSSLYLTTCRISCLKWDTASASKPVRNAY